MPELPEVETTCRGVAPAVCGHRINRVVIRDRRLRWPLPASFAKSLASQTVHGVKRRAKYLLLELDRGTLIVHLGMSGSLRVMPANTAPLTHDHVDIVLDSGRCLRFNDPRRFGSMHFVLGDLNKHKLLKHLGPEPLEDNFDTEYLLASTRHRKVAIKQLLMNASVVVGVGNIYASEALFRAGVRPTRAAGKIKFDEAAALAASIKAVLAEAIEVGGTTLRDYVNVDGAPGYFVQKLFVYERAGEKCRRCEAIIKKITQGQRSTYYCPSCQK